MKRHIAVAAFSIAAYSLAAMYAQAETNHPIKPEMIITFSHGNLACLVREDLREILDHAAKDEHTKMQAMMIQNGGDCFMLSPTKRVKVISIEYNNPDMPDMGLIEFVGEDTTSLHGAWSLSVGAEPVPDRPKPARRSKDFCPDVNLPYLGYDSLCHHDPQQ